MDAFCEKRLPLPIFAINFFFLSTLWVFIFAGLKLNMADDNLPKAAAAASGEEEDADFDEAQDDGEDCEGRNIYFAGPL